MIEFLLSKFVVPLTLFFTILKRSLECLQFAFLFMHLSLSKRFCGLWIWTKPKSRAREGH